MKFQRIAGLLEKLAPKSLAESWDNPGIQVGNPQQEIKRILVCLDVSQPVVETAIERGVDLIVSHHPVMLFKGLLNIRTDLYDGRLLQQLLSKNIAVYSAHTNLDIAQGGCNDILAGLCGLERVEGFVPVQGENEEFMGRIGYVGESVTVVEFAKKLCASLNTSHVRLVKGGPDTVHKVALCSGAGAEFISQAAFKGADLYITGDLKYHEAQQGVKQGINIIDAGHFATEFPMVKSLAEYLRKELADIRSDVEVIEDSLSKDFFQVIRREGE